jgi:hypothetical protein
VRAGAAYTDLCCCRSVDGNLDEINRNVLAVLLRSKAVNDVLVAAVMNNKTVQVADMHVKRAVVQQLFNGVLTQLDGPIPVSIATRCCTRAIWSGVREPAR